MINNIQDTKNINSIKNSIELMKNFVDYNNTLIKLNELKEKTNDSNLWNDIEYATSILKEVCPRIRGSKKVCPEIEAAKRVIYVKKVCPKLEGSFCQGGEEEF